MKASTARAASPTSVNLKLLQSFVLVAELGSFKQAGDRLHRSRSAISMQIRALEDQAGVHLLERSSKQVALTPEGRSFLACARRAIDEVNAGFAQLRRPEAERRGRIRLACSPSVAASRLPRLLSIFEQDYPFVSMEIRELPSADLLEAVRSAQVDLGIGTVVENPDIDFEVLLDDRLYALGSESLLAGYTSIVRLRDLASMPLLMSVDSTAQRLQLEQEAARRRLTLNVRHECINAYTLVAMALEGLGVAIQPESIIGALPLPPRIRRLRVVQPELVRQMALVRRRGQLLDAATTRFVEILRSEFGQPHTSRGHRI